MRDGLLCPFVEVEVAPWSNSEVRKVLEANSVDPTKVDDRVCASLCNPRLLGLAIGLLNASEVEELTELSDDRLLFEYMRRYATIGQSGVTAAQFAQTLRTQAAEIIERRTSTAMGRPSLVTSGLEDELGAVAQSQFFRPLAGDPTGYELVAEGLPLALGLSIVHALRIEEAAGRDPAEVMDTIVEPILSLDRTADVLGAAVIVASLEKATSARVRATLIRSYVGLQNLSHEDRDTFLALGREAPGAFVEAAREVCTSSDRVPNFDWIVAALSRACEDKGAWRTIREGVREWLSTHSMSRAA